MTFLIIFENYLLLNNFENYFSHHMRELLTSHQLRELQLHVSRHQFNWRTPHPPLCSCTVHSWMASLHCELACDLWGHQGQGEDDNLQEDFHKESWTLQKYLSKIWAVCHWTQVGKRSYKTILQSFGFKSFRTWRLHSHRRKLMVVVKTR